VSAASIEAAVIDQLRVLFKSPEVVMATQRAATAEGAKLSGSSGNRVGDFGRILCGGERLDGEVVEGSPLGLSADGWRLGR
jgi:hypothetical protein